MTKKVLALVHHGISEVELSFPIAMSAIFGGINYEVVSVESSTDITAWGGLKILASKHISEVKPIEYDALLLPGVSSFFLDEQLKNEKLLKIITNMNSNNKIIAAICLSPLFLAKAGILKGKTFTSDADEKAYSKYDIGCYINKPAFRDGNVITGKGTGFVHFTQLLFDSLGQSAQVPKLTSFMREGGILLEDVIHEDNKEAGASCSPAINTSRNMCCG